MASNFIYETIKDKVVMITQQSKPEYVIKPQSNKIK